MKRVKNLIESKGLINTFKKTKTKNYISKSILKKKGFFFLKFKAIKLKTINYKLTIGDFFYKSFSKHYSIVNSRNSIHFKYQRFFKITIMFIKLDF